MGDPRPRVARPDMVQNGLVRDFPRQAHVVRRNPVCRRAHERATPMRRGPRDMGHAPRAGPDQKVPRRFSGARQHQRAPAQQRPQQNLQASIPANIVEGAPHRRDGLDPIPVDRTRQAGQGVHDQLRHARRPRGEENPLRVVWSGPRGIGGRESRAAGDDRAHAAGFQGGAIGHNGIHRRGRHDERRDLPRQIGRTQHEAARHAIELDERQRRRELIPRRDEDRAPTQLLEPTPQARAPHQLPQPNARLSAPERALGQGARGPHRVPQGAPVTGRHVRRAR